MDERLRQFFLLLWIMFMLSVVFLALFVYAPDPLSPQLKLDVSVPGSSAFNQSVQGWSSLVEDIQTAQGIAGS